MDLGEKAEKVALHHRAGFLLTTATSISPIGGALGTTSDVIRGICALHSKYYTKFSTCSTDSENVSQFFHDVGFSRWNMHVIGSESVRRRKAPPLLHQIVSVAAKMPDYGKSQHSDVTPEYIELLRVSGEMPGRLILDANCVL